jgi:hypothetical protein
MSPIWPARVIVLLWILLLCCVHVIECTKSQLSDKYKIFDYNKIDHVEIESFHSFHDQYFYNLIDNKDTTTVNVVLGVATNECKYLLDDCAPFLGIQRMAAHDVLHAVSIPAAGFPLVMNSCAEVFFYPVGSSILEPAARTTELTNKEFTQWSRMITALNTTLTNRFSYPIVIAWVSELGLATAMTVLEPNYSFRVSSLLGHVFTALELTDPSAYPNHLELLPMVDFMMVESANYYFSPNNRLETCEFIENSEYVGNQSISCDDMPLRFYDFTSRHWASKRQGINFVQPKLVAPTSRSQNGFELRKLPDATFRWLNDWYAREQLVNARTEGSVGLCINQQVAPSQITELPADLQQQLAAEIQPIVQDWYSGESILHMKSIYGIRY